jgi:hypothetical protein
MLNGGRAAHTGQVSGNGPQQSLENLMSRRTTSTGSDNGTDRRSRVVSAIVDAWADLRYANRRYIEVSTGRKISPRKSSIS